MTTFVACDGIVHMCAAGVTVLVDPWLLGELAFLQASWIYSGAKIHTKNLDWRAVAERSDFMLITQASRDRLDSQSARKQ